MPHLATMDVTTDEPEIGRDLLQARENFSTILNASPALHCIIDLNGLRYREINKSYEQCTGYSRSEVIGEISLRLGLWSKVEDRDGLIRKLLADRRVPCHQQVFRTKTGESLITLLSAEIIQFDDRPCALLVAEDITVRQQAEEARLVLAQHLINAQEAECRRVGRELHDSIGHSLTMLILDLEKTRLSLTDASAETAGSLTRLSNKLKDLGQDVGTLSHRLHSSTLELLGLAVAINALSRDFSEQYQVQTHCKCSNIPDNLPAEVSLCLFRVAQEALHNIAKHSHAVNIDIELHGHADFFYLSISDDGVGFARDAASIRPGLGLISMRERVHLVGGEFIIITKPGSGTRVEAIVPVAKASLASLQPHSSLSLVN
jgi:PAS domain S-box-containing protein